MIELFNMVQADRERGHVQGEGFFESNISTIAAPVRDHSGRVVAALGTTVPAPHVEEGRAETLIAGVCDAAAELSELLNYRPQAQTQTQTQTQTAQLLSLNSRRAGGGHV